MYKPLQTLTRSFLAVFLLAASPETFAQTYTQLISRDTVLNTAIPSGNYDYTVTNTLKMLPGFTASGNNGNYRFRVDPVAVPSAKFKVPVINGSSSSRVGIENYSGKDYFGYMFGNNVPLFSPGNYTVNTSNPVVAKINGSGGVSPTGSATYNIPIEIPAGINSMQPTLAISYNSQGSRGLLGLGWEINGVSAISRTSKDFWRDGETKEPSFTASDCFAMDGNRLIINTGTYGSNGATYQTEKETFADITSIGSYNSYGPDHFIVKTNDGKVYEYGNTNDSKIKPTMANTNSSPPAVMWLLNKVTDMFGNTVTYTYVEGKQQPAISEIKYTGNGSQAGNYKITFSYDEITPWAQVSYMPIGNSGAYASLTRNLVLNNIKILNGTTELYRYEFTYLYMNDVLLTSVQQTITASNKVNQTSIEWQDVNHTTVPTGTSYSPNTVAFYQNYGDLNGDGLDDQVSTMVLNYASNSLVLNQNTPDYAEFKIQLSAINGGVVPAPIITDFIDIKDINFSFNTAAGTRSKTIGNMVGASDLYEDGQTVTRFNNMQLVDIDNDQKDEIIVYMTIYDKEGDGYADGYFHHLYLKYDLEDLHHPVILAKFTCPNYNYYHGISGSSYALNINFLDFDGDKNLEYFFTLNNATYDSNLSFCMGIFTLGDIPLPFIKDRTGDFTGGSGGSGLPTPVLSPQTNQDDLLYTYTFDPSLAYNISIISTPNKVYITDINGNGKNEIFIVKCPTFANSQPVYGVSYPQAQYGVYYEAWEYDKTSNSFVNIITNYNWYFDYNHDIFFADYNGDGKQDIIKHLENGNAWTYLISTGNGFLAPVSMPELSDKKPGKKYDDNAQYNFYTADLDADGRADYVESYASWANGNRRYNYTHLYFNKPDGIEKHDITREVYPHTGNDLADNLIFNGTKDDVLNVNYQFPDLNGDGIKELTYTIVPGTGTDGDNWQMYMNRYLMTDLANNTDDAGKTFLPYQTRFASAITDGFGNRLEYTYKLLCQDGNYAADYVDNSVGPKPYAFLSSTEIPNLSKSPVNAGDTPPSLLSGSIKPVNGRGLYTVNTMQTLSNTTNKLGTYSQYDYRSGIVDLQGNGFLGFAESFEYISSSSYAGSTLSLANTITRATLSTLNNQNKQLYATWIFNSKVGGTISSTYKTYSVTGLTSTVSANKHFLSLPVYENVADYIGGIRKETSIAYDGTAKDGKILSTTITHKRISITTGAEQTDLTQVTNYNNYKDYSNVGATGYKLRVNQEVSSSDTRPGDAAYLHKITYTYDPVTGVLQSEINGDGKVDENSNSLAVTTNYSSRNSNGMPLITQVSGYGSSGLQETRKTEKQFDATGWYLVSEKNSLDQVTIYEYYTNGLGQLKSKTDINGLTTSYTYNAWGELSTVTHPDNNVVTSGSYWAPSGDADNALYYVQKSVTNGPTTKIYYDALDREVRTETQVFGDKNGNTFDTKWQITRTLYDTRGRVWKKSHPYYLGFTGTILWSVTTYDIYNRPVEQYPVEGQTIKTTYAYSGSDATVTSPDGKSKTSKSDATGKPYQILEKSTSGSVIGTINYTYYSHGNAKTSTSQGVTLAWEYDAMARQTKLTDPHTGITRSRHDAFGEPIYEKDALNHETHVYYNKLGQVTSKSVLDGVLNTAETVNYTYVTDGKAINGLSTATKTTGSTTIASETYTYETTLGLLKSVSEAVNGVAFTTTYNYDIYGRLSSKEYPNTSAIVQYTYSTIGDLVQISAAINGSSQQPVWELQKENAYGQATQYMYGNNTHVVQKTYDANFQTLLGIFGNGNYLFNYQMDFDHTNGNVLYRQIGGRSVTVGSTTYNQLKYRETFSYDSDFDRLTGMTPSFIGQQPSGFSLPGSFTISYDEKGNFTSRTGFNSTNYPAATPYQLTAANASSPMGDIVPYPSAGQNITYSTFNKPVSITQGLLSANFTYGVDNQRRVMVYSNDNAAHSKTTYYMGDYEQETGNLGTNYERIYITAPTGLCAAIINRQLYYTFTDHLGTVMALTDVTGALGQEYSFDAWGRRRDPNTWAALATNAVPGLLTRGFTFHEHLDAFQLINMNGRLYDPQVGRFLNADPYIQAPDNTQNYNRYSYCLNNPLKYNDPSGELFGIDDMLAAVVIGAVIAAASHTVAYGFATNWTFTNWSWGSFATSVVVGGISGAATFGVGEEFGVMGNFAHELGRAAMHGMIQGMGNLAEGGDFGIGFVTGGLSSSLGELYGKFGGKLLSKTAGGQIGFASLTGGVTSWALGGNFWQGLAQGGMVGGLNQTLHSSKKGNLVKPKPKEEKKNTNNQEESEQQLAQTLPLPIPIPVVPPFAYADVDEVHTNSYRSPKSNSLYAIYSVPKGFTSETSLWTVEKYGVTGQFDMSIRPQIQVNRLNSLGSDKTYFWRQEGLYPNRIQAIIAEAGYVSGHFAVYGRVPNLQYSPSQYKYDWFRTLLGF